MGGYVWAVGIPEQGHGCYAQSNFHRGQGATGYSLSHRLALGAAPAGLWGAVAGYVWPGWRNWLRANGLRLAVGYAGPCRFT